MTKEQLKEWRVTLGLSQKQMATYVGIPWQTWRNWEQGTRSLNATAVSLVSLMRVVETMEPDLLESRLEKARAVPQFK